MVSYGTSCTIVRKFTQRSGGTPESRYHLGPTPPTRSGRARDQFRKTRVRRLLISTTTTSINYGTHGIIVLCIMFILFRVAVALLLLYYYYLLLRGSFLGRETKSSLSPQPF